MELNFFRLLDFDSRFRVSRESKQTTRYKTNEIPRMKKKAIGTLPKRMDGDEQSAREIHPEDISTKTMLARGPSSTPAKLIKLATRAPYCSCKNACHNSPSFFEKGE